MRSRRQCEWRATAQTGGLPTDPQDPGPDTAQYLCTGVSGQKKSPKEAPQANDLPCGWVSF